MNNNIINIEYSTDSYDCETCGSDWASAYEITYNGKTYGGPARAHCYSGYSNYLSEVAPELLADIGFENNEEEYILNQVSDEQFISMLETLGFKVVFNSVSFNEENY